MVVKVLLPNAAAVAGGDDDDDDDDKPHSHLGPASCGSITHRAHCRRLAIRSDDEQLW